MLQRCLGLRRKKKNSLNRQIQTKWLLQNEEYRLLVSDRQIENRKCMSETITRALNKNCIIVVYSMFVKLNLYLRELSRKYPAILNISRSGHVAFM